MEGYRCCEPGNNFIYYLKKLYFYIIPHYSTLVMWRVKNRQLPVSSFEEIPPPQYQIFKSGWGQSEISEDLIEALIKKRSVNTALNQCISFPQKFR